MIRIPPAALLLGFAGLVPFVWGAILVLDFPGPANAPLPEVLLGDGRLIMIRYGGIILPFMAGVLWGFATKASGAQAAVGYILSVIPALWWFFMPGSGVTSALTNLATGFVGVLLIDYAFHRWELAPPWWMTLRIQLTVIVVICLGIGIFM
ncbi:DUF3429 domain-containing protein [Marimonas sp. MJW-29]|uniref:DUF3429 domain-containing protein n=1 Tax=Sulfitobacter sediminis TaxID=3234186 RepID=A0ABV3RHR8_9RHOB